MKNFYRKEIDGLRALGVIGVIIYHLEFFLDNKQILPGGFLGVDIFFVVSGYLITKILHDEYNLTGSISFINFYFRRAKRLLPALIFVIFFSNFFAYKLLFPSEYDHYIKSVISSLFFVSNIFFHYSGQNYGESVISEKPLLHTWSLGVEEQFYIFFPIFLIFTLRFLNKYRVLLFILFIVFSFFLCFKISSTHPSFNFYFLTSRAWELLAGGLIVFINKYFEKFDNRAMSNLISLIGLSLIIVSFFKLDDVNKHPSTYTIIPVIGCFLILLNNDKNNYIKKFLSLSLFRGIGLISYSLYLWHYPIFVFGKISNFTGIDNQNLLAKLILLLAAFIISIISYFFIEKFFRKKINFKIINFIIGILSIYFLCIFSLNILKIKHEKQFPLIAKELKKSTWFETKQYFRPCFQRKKYFCSFNNQSENSVFLIGDSIMASLQNELKKTLISKDFQFITMTNAGCDFIKISDKDNQNIFCNSEIYKERLINIKKKPNSILIFHLNYSNKIFKSDFEAQERFVDDLYNFLDNGHKLILIYPIPQMDVHTSNILTKKIRSNKKNLDNLLKDKNNFIHIDYNQFKNDSYFILKILDKVNHPNVFKLNVEDVFCNSIIDKKCVANDEQNLFLIDNNHLSNFSANIISQKLYKIISNIN